MEGRHITITVEVGGERYVEIRTWSDVQERLGEKQDMFDRAVAGINRKFPKGYKLIKIETGIIDDKP